MPPSISELITAYKDRTGASYEVVARRSEVPGRKMTAAYLYRLGTGDVKGWPKDELAFESLAVGLETTVLAIVLGFAVELGIDVRAPALASQIPYPIDRAPERLRDALVGMARAIAYPDEVRASVEDPAADPDLRGDPLQPGVVDFPGSAGDEEHGRDAQ